MSFVTGGAAAMENKLLKLSPGLIKGVKHFEGLYLEPYICPTGHLTIGYGHLCSDSQGRITEEEADNLLYEDLMYAARGIFRSSPSLLGTKPYRFEALVSWTFNLGLGAYNTSTLKKRVDTGMWDSATSEILRWKYGTVNGQKVVLPGLERRRQWEAKVFSTGDYDV